MPPTPPTTNGVPRLPELLPCQLQIWWFPWPTHLEFLEGLKELRKVLPLLLQFIIKDTNEEPDVEAHNTRYGCPECRDLCPRDTGLQNGCVHQRGSPPRTPLLFRDFSFFESRIHYSGTIDEITGLELSLKPLSPFWRSGVLLKVPSL